MKKQFVCLSIATLLILTGCDTKPGDIQKWKEAGKVSKLEGALSDSQQFIRLDAIAALAELNDPSSIPALAALFTDKDKIVVHKAVETVAQIGGPQSEAPMLQAITFDTVQARLPAAKTLGELKSTKAVEPLCLALEDKHRKVVIAAAHSLGEIASPQAIDALAKSADRQDDTEIRYASILALQKIGGEETFPALIKALSDDSEKVRQIAIDVLRETGPSAAPAILPLLRSESRNKRASAILLLNDLDAVPHSGDDQIWFGLATLAAAERAEINPEKAMELANANSDGVQAFVDAMTHPDEAIREHAFIALLQIGEPAAEPLLAAIDRASPAAQKWFSGRTDWGGAPAWELDVWGAATALSPKFYLDKRNHMLLTSGTEKATALLKSNHKATREEIPDLINLFATIDSDDGADQRKATALREQARNTLAKAKVDPTLPLRAALQDDDLNIAAYAAQTLQAMGNPQVADLFMENFKQRVEQKVDLENSAFYETMIEFNKEEVTPLLQQVRPNEKWAIKVFQDQYPDIRVTSIPLITDKNIQAVPFRLKYLKDGKSKELRVIFRPDAEGHWLPTPPMPETLP